MYICINILIRRQCCVQSDLHWHDAVTHWGECSFRAFRFSLNTKVYMHNLFMYIVIDVPLYIKKTDAHTVICCATIHVYLHMQCIINTNAFVNNLPRKRNRRRDVLNFFLIWLVYIILSVENLTHPVWGRCFINKFSPKINCWENFKDTTRNS